MRAVGIDLGTANSVIAVLNDSEPAVVANTEGSRTTPSVVAFAGNAEVVIDEIARSTGVLVGETAKRQAVTNVDRTIRSVKRHMGTDWTVTIDGKAFTPQQISAFILQKLKRDAEAYLGEKITGAVITIPANFTDAQRQAIKQAAWLADLNVMRIISETTAAGIGYHWDKGGSAEKILIFDLGAGSLSVSLLDLSDGVVEVEATSGDNHLGGDDWDQRIVDWLVQDFNSDQGVNLSRDKVALQRLREAAERAKIELSHSTQAQISVPYIAESPDGPLHLERVLTRTEFQRMTADLIDRCKAPFEQVIKDANVKVKDIDRVVLVGGSTRMPAVAQLVKSLGNGREPHKGVNPDEVVAVGACMQAGIFTGEVSEVLSLDVTPLSLGIETKGGIFTKLIERNTTIPTKRSEIFTTAEDNQSSVLIQAYQGEREIAAYNKKLATFEVTGIAPSARGTPQIEVTFEIDPNHEITVSAKDLNSGANQQVNVIAEPTVATRSPDDYTRDLGASTSSAPPAQAASVADVVRPSTLIPESVPIRETKVLLVGEGTVGKTSLVTALRDEPFQEQARTHGIEVHAVVLRNPDSGGAMTLRFWDFGGQQVYRTTHQFFFSSRALYLVVWNARAGQDKDDVAGWLSRIHQRVGDAARVMLVATHSDTAEPDLDYEMLRRKFPGLISGHYAVDNKTGRGIADLRTAIVREATAQHVEESLPDAWVRARDAILGRAATEPQISYREFAAACADQGMPQADAEKLAVLLHRLGQIIYHSDDETLRDLVILNPEWLSKAIGHVLDDGPTREALGILDHARLPQIWLPRPGEPAYSKRHYPYFLRLMEKFDVSYRLEDGRHSLIAQLVPAREPDLPWHGDTPVAGGLRRLALICKMTEPITGLISALTVRLSYADTGLRWRTGVFLRHPNPMYASEALIQLTGDTELKIEVRAPSPDFFLHVLRDSFEHLTRRWPGLGHRMFISCPAVTSSGCVGRFPLATLLRARQQQVTTMMCQECLRLYQVEELLTGFARPPQQVELSEPGVTADQLRDIAAGIGRVDERIRDLQAAAAANAYAMRRLVALASTEIVDCPRLFTLVAVKPAGLERLKPHQRRFRLTLWCEHVGGWHPSPQGGTEFDRPAEWFRQVSRYARPVLALLRVALPLAGAVADVVLTKDQLDFADRELDLMKELLSELPDEPADEADWIAASDDGKPAPADGAYLRGVRRLLNDVDRYQQYGGLKRIQAASGEYLWICEAHLAAYDPGLPAM